MEGITVHYQKKAVSIRYNEEHVAPEISDKAAGLDAEELIRLAQEAGIYIHKDPVLLSYLESLPEGASIPRELYLIMAEILSYTYLLQGKLPEKWRREDGSIAIDRKI